VSYTAEILADSISPQGHRLTTMVATFPRIVLSEFNTHRAFSRNSASSRAIPVSKQIRRVMQHPFVPDQFGINQPGMQATEYLTGEKHAQARAEWIFARTSAVTSALQLLLGSELFQEKFGRQQDDNYVLSSDEILEWINVNGDWLDDLVKNKLSTDQARALNVHKQTVNRLLEPFMWHTAIITATEWSNFFGLRTHADAQPEIREAALRMQAAYSASTPETPKAGEWHLPLIQPKERGLLNACKISSARCARVSYETHTGKRDLSADITLYNRLVDGGHMSPLEHVATPFTDEEWTVRNTAAVLYEQSGRTRNWPAKRIADLVDSTQFSGNFRGWQQFRKTMSGENDFSKRS
jgi:thymidylate synthase ThyX